MDSKRQIRVPGGGAGSPTAEADIVIREKILHILEVYPAISPTMLQNALGPSLKAAVWKPIMEQMLDEGVIEMVQETKQNPGGRYITYKKLQLVSSTGAKSRGREQPTH